MSRSRLLRYKQRTEFACSCLKEMFMFFYTKNNNVLQIATHLAKQINGNCLLIKMYVVFFIVSKHEKKLYDDNDLYICNSIQRILTRISFHCYRLFR